ncbi:kinase-like domain-containing protein [Aspergillus insuetus]
MAADRLPDLVIDTKLQVEIHEGYTHYLTIESGSRRQWRKETWRRIKCLGEGATGQVWLEECSEDEKQGQLQAVKIMPKRGWTDYYRELEAIAKFSQRLFVKSLGWYETERSVFIVMEHMNGSPASHLQGPLPEEEVKHITFQVLEGLASLHESGFVHRDLKPDNILVASKGPSWWVKIGDFGFSKRITEGNCLQTIVGTQNYFAPENLGLNHRTMDTRTIESRYTCAVDMWSLGVTMFYMLCHSYPFKDRELLAYTQGAPFPSADLSLHNVTRKAHAIIAALLTVDASSRLSARAALRDQWLTRLDEDFPTTTEEGLPSSLSEAPGHSFATDSSRSRPMDSTVQLTMSKLTVSEPPDAPTQTPSTAIARRRDENHLDALRTLHDKGVELKNHLELQKSETLLRQVAEGFEIVLGPNDSNTLEAKVDLGKVHSLQKQYEDAHLVFLQAAEGYAETQGPFHKDTLMARLHVIRSLFQQGKVQEAQDDLQQVIEVQKALFGEEHKQTIQFIYLACEIYYQQEDYSAAATLLTQLLDPLRRDQGSDNLLPHVLRDLGCCQYFMEMYKEAQAAFQELVDLDTRSRLTTSVALWNILWLVETLCKQDIVGQTQPLLRRVLESSPS